MKIHYDSMACNVGKISLDCSKVTNVKVLIAKKGNGLGQRVPILRWADSIGMDWVKKTVKSYRKGAK